MGDYERSDVPIFVTLRRFPDSGFIASDVVCRRGTLLEAELLFRVYVRVLVLHRVGTRSTFGQAQLVMIRYA